MANFVLVHGAFHGGWCWARVAAHLRHRGHTVFTPTQTGLGERRHLLQAGITLDTFVQDITEVMDAEELHDAVLVGHSFGGLAISGVADRMPERVRGLIYLDSRILEPGESILDVDPIRAGDWKQRAEATGGLAIPAPPADYFGITDPNDLAWVNRRMTPHPLGTFTSKLNLANPVGNDRPRTYIACTDPVYTPLAPCHRWARGRAGWGYTELRTGHDAMVSAPQPLARMLEEVGDPL